jgi:hypothetical protein
MKSHLKDHPNNFTDILPNITEVMRRAMVASKSDVIGLLMVFLVELDVHLLMNCHRNGEFGEMLELLREAFHAINDYFVLWNIIKFLTVLFARFQASERAYIRNLFGVLYEKVLEVAYDYSEHGIIRPFGFPLMKLALMLEEKLFAPVAAIEELTLLNTICQKYLVTTNFEQNPDDHPYFVRLQANVFKCFWLLFDQNIPVQADLKLLVAQILRFNNYLLKFAENFDTGLSVFTGMQVCSSFLEISCLYQPKMQKMSNNSVFQFAIYRLHKKALKKIVKYLGYFLFEAEVGEYLIVKNFSFQTLKIYLFKLSKFSFSNCQYFLFHSLQIRQILPRLALPRLDLVQQKLPGSRQSNRFLPHRSNVSRGRPLPATARRTAGISVGKVEEEFHCHIVAFDALV